MSLLFISSVQITAYADVLNVELEGRLDASLEANLLAAPDTTQDSQSTLSDTQSTALQLAGIDLDYFPQNSGSYVFEKKHKPVKRNVKKKRKTVKKRKPKMRSIEGYQTKVDAKGNRTREYVHGEVEKGRQGVYTGYLYNKDNKKSFTYGKPSSGTMQVQTEGEVIMETERKANPQY